MSFFVKKKNLNINLQNRSETLAYTSCCYVLQRTVELWKAFAFVVFWVLVSFSWRLKFPWKSMVSSQLCIFRSVISSEKFETGKRLQMKHRISKKIIIFFSQYVKWYFCYVDIFYGWNSFLSLKSDFFICSSRFTKVCGKDRVVLIGLNVEIFSIYHYYSETQLFSEILRKKSSQFQCFRLKFLYFVVWHN